MSTINDLNNLFKDIADAVREKKGTSELINPKDFGVEIRGISGGGSSSNVVYYDVRNTDAAIKDILLGFSELVKTDETFSEDIAPLTVFLLSTGNNIQNIANIINYISINLNLEVYINGSYSTIKGFFDAIGADISSIPTITKEEFYSFD